MLRFTAATFLAASLHVGRCRDALFVLGNPEVPEDEILAELTQALGDLKDVVERVPGARTLKLQIARIHKRISEDQAYEPRALAVILTELLNNVMDEFSGHMFLHVPGERVHLLSRWFPESVTEAFPASEQDLMAAGRCFAKEEWTASVFHVMRGVESALQRWAGVLGVVLTVPLTEANWRNLAEASKRKLRDIENQPKSAARSSELEQLGDIAVQFENFRLAYRNHVAHGRRHYSLQEAADILSAVLTFMRKLAESGGGDE